MEGFRGLIGLGGLGAVGIYDRVFSRIHNGCRLRRVPLRVLSGFSGFRGALGFWGFWAFSGLWV